MPGEPRAKTAPAGNALDCGRNDLWKKGNLKPFLPSRKFIVSRESGSIVIDRASVGENALFAGILPAMHRSAAADLVTFWLYTRTRRVVLPARLRGIEVYGLRPLWNRSRRHGGSALGLGRANLDEQGLSQLPGISNGRDTSSRRRHTRDSIRYRIPVRCDEICDPHR
jgi:hypothetical protein